jgi:site-specific recombinase XerD
MTSLVTYRPPLPASDLDAAFADFLRVDVASGDASEDTIRNYRNEVAIWVAWCVEQGLDAATATVMHIKRYRSALIEAKYNPITIRWKLSIVRRFYEAARNAGLRPDNPAAGVKSPRVRQATEDFKYLCDEKLAKLFAAIPDPDQVTGPEKIRRLRNLLMVSMMALQGLRTVEVHRANLEDLLEKGEHLTLMLRGKTRNRIAYLRPDTAKRMKEYVALCGQVSPDKHAIVHHHRFSFRGRPAEPPLHPRAHRQASSADWPEAAGHFEPCFEAHRRHVGLLAHRRPARGAGVSGPRRPAHDVQVRARGGHGQEKSGAVHSGEGGLKVCGFSRTLARSRSKGVYC